MRFPIPDDEFRGTDAEWLWVRSLSDGNYAVDSIPFDLMGISADDIVSGYLEDGYLNFGGIVSQSGNRTIRLKLFSSSIKEVLADLNISDAEYEGTQSGPKPMYACNLPPTVDYDDLRARLDKLEKCGVLEYEEANV
jgi:hypothetical protein